MLYATSPSPVFHLQHHFCLGTLVLHTPVESKTQSGHSNWRFYTSDKGEMRLKSLFADAVSLLLLVGALGFALSPTANADDGDTMTQTAKVAQAIQSKLHPMVQVPLSYNYNQNRQPSQNYTQAQLQLTPLVPFFFRCWPCHRS